MKTERYNFHVPDHLIAQNPLENRSDSRLLVYNRQQDKITDSFINELAIHLTSNHFLVFNQSRVFSARIAIRKKENRRPGEILVLKINSSHQIEILTDKARKYPVGTVVILPDQTEAVITDEFEHGTKILETSLPLFTTDYFDRFGEVPLPPYIRKKPDADDKLRYQTIYSKDYGSAAAPTAGLHFDDRIFRSLTEKHIGYSFISLHVGLGTFQPIYSEEVEGHQIHSELYQISPETADQINKAIRRRLQIIPVGTTSLRTLETAFDSGIIPAGSGESSLYIYPPYTFKVARGLITNFHTPKSSLAVLVSALVGIDKLLEIYAYAVEKEYRFFSYGDAMLIL